MGYQLQLPEAVAVVYSPITEALYRIFRIKESGIDELLRCEKGGFHPHGYKESPLFEECSHVEVISGEANGVLTETVDLRFT